MKVTTQAWLRDDLENILTALAEAQGERGSDEYRKGFLAALKAMARAIGITLSTSMVLAQTKRAGVR